MITDHLLTDAAFISTPNRGGEITPRFIVIHYTAGYTAKSAIQTLTNPNRKGSAHLIIDKDGTTTQLVPLNIRAWHAGKSAYRGYKGMNSRSIGIELVNIGWLKLLSQTPNAETKFQDSYGNIISLEQIGRDVLESPHAKVGDGNFYWPVYPEFQLAKLEEIVAELIRIYDIIDIVSHEEIDLNGWKTDPGPAFPMRRFKALLPDREVEEDQYEITASALRVRSGPGPEYDVIGQASKGDIIEVSTVDGKWGRIDSDGWIHMGFVRPI